MISLDEKFLMSLLATPTAPFKEERVKVFLKSKLDADKIPYFEDPAGNIVVGVPSKEAYLKLVQKPSKEPVRLFIAHMDHPGFHGVKWLTETKLSAKWYGGSPKAFLEGAAVQVTNGFGIDDEGIIESVVLTKSQASISELTIEVKGSANRDTIRAHDLFGSFKFRAPIWKEENVFYTKAADDLAGVFSIVSVAKRMKGKPFLGLLTRAEEVGFIGAIYHFDLGWLSKRKREVICVSLETSRTLPNAEIGKGPVVRLGDRNTTFDAGAVRVFWEMAEKKFKGKYQRRIMDGGTCEGSVAMAHGFPTIAISVPLGNYHNQSLEGGPDSRGKDGPAPEFIHSYDLTGLLNLCEALMQEKLPWANPWANQLNKFKGLKKEYAKLMKVSPR